LNHDRLLPHTKSEFASFLVPILLAAGAAVYLSLTLHVRPGNVQLGLAVLGAELCVVGLLARIPFARMGASDCKGEALRWLILLCVGFYLTLPYARPERVGAGDAQDYAQHIADFIAQSRQHVFPVLVGQSGFASNGAFNPLRTAPYLEYAAGALYALTCGCLGGFAVQNLAIILSLCAAAFSCYACLRRLAIDRPWMCLALALLYVSSPGVLALVYGGDMIPSWLTLPYLPLYAYLLSRIAGGDVRSDRVFSLAAVVALIWFIHAPIAMWLSLIALPVVILRLATNRRLRRTQNVLIGLGALFFFAVLAGFEFVSVAELRLPALVARQLEVFRGPAVYANLEAGWSGFLRPVSADGSRLLSDLQLSLPLWVCVGAGALAWRRCDWGLRFLLLASAGLLLLLIPIPGLTGQIWSLMPSWVDRITDQWPMQRFYPILSVFAVFIGLQAFRQLSRPRWRRAVLAGLALGCLWSGYEARRFLERGFRVALPPALSQNLMWEDNAVSAIYSSGMLGEPRPSFSVRSLAEELQLRMLDRDGLSLRQANREGLVGGPADAPRGASVAFTVNETGDRAELQAPLRLPAGRSSLFTLDFNGEVPSGTLVVSGTHTWKEFFFPEGERGGRKPGVPFVFSVAHPEGETLQMRFVAGAGSPRLGGFGGLRVTTYKPSELPLSIEGHSPLRIRAHTVADGWLETPRIFIAGYHATVNGGPAVIARSPSGLVMIRVPAGTSEVELGYPGSPLLQAAFWASLTGWLLLPVCLFARHLCERMALRRIPRLGPGIDVAGALDVVDKLRGCLPERR
jgi:hypothetical protein